MDRKRSPALAGKPSCKHGVGIERKDIHTAAARRCLRHCSAQSRGAVHGCDAYSSPDIFPLSMFLHAPQPHELDGLSHRFQGPIHTQHPQSPVEVEMLSRAIETSSYRRRHLFCSPKLMLKIEKHATHGGLKRKSCRFVTAMPFPLSPQKGMACWLCTSQERKWEEAGHRFPNRIGCLAKKLDWARQQKNNANPRLKEEDPVGHDADLKKRKLTNAALEEFTRPLKLEFVKKSRLPPRHHQLFQILERC